jgi:hypothetical protein
MLDPNILIGGAVQPGTVPTGIPNKQTAIELAAEAELRSRMIAAAMEILSSLDTADSLGEAAELAARSLCEPLEAKRILVLWRRWAHSRLAVISDSQEVSGSEAKRQRRLAFAAAEEIAVGETFAHWPPAEDSDRMASMAVAQLAKHLPADSVIGLCLSDNEDCRRGVVLVIDPANDAATNLLSAIDMPLASKLIAVERLQPTLIQHALRGFTNSLWNSRWYVLVCGLVILTLIMMLPMPYKVTAVVELQPIKQRFIAVPIEGSLQSAHVRPGDIVEQGDLLARINPREIEYELAIIRAELNRAKQEKKGLLAQHDVAGSKIAGLETDRLQMRSELLQYQKDNLEIRSPIGGMVVSGDLKQSEGMPMARGDTLFEIAELGHMVAEIAVPENDIAHVREGMQVEFFVNALPNDVIGGTISRLHPRSQLRDHDNVYIAEVRVVDPTNVLRPGMRGRAKIWSDPHTLMWNLFHKAYYAFCRALGL